MGIVLSGDLEQDKDLISLEKTNPMVHTISRSDLEDLEEKTMKVEMVGPWEVVEVLETEPLARGDEVEGSGKEQEEEEEEETVELLEEVEADDLSLIHI